MPAPHVTSFLKATSNPLALHVTSYCLLAQSFATSQALLISQTPASCLPFPVSQLPPKQCPIPILPTMIFMPLSCLISPAACQHLLPIFSTSLIYSTCTALLSHISAQTLWGPGLCAKPSGVKTE